MKCSLCSNEFEGKSWSIAITGQGVAHVYEPVCHECFVKVDRKITDILEGLGDVVLPTRPPVLKRWADELRRNPCFECVWSDVEDDHVLRCYRGTDFVGPPASERCEYFEEFRED